MSFDTTTINRSLHRFDGHAELWLFGYGSLVWKADFGFIERCPARVRGWSRRFWQGSHDHRGTPAAPGRVLTLVEDAGAICHGMAYRITPAVFEHLDAREKNGYLRCMLPLELTEHSAADGLAYVATPLNAAWLGPASDREIAMHIARAHGPSGTNRDYVIRLADALRDLDAQDAHVFAIERELRALDRAVTGQRTSAKP